MQQKPARCIKRVGESCRCPSCNGFSIRYGKSASGTQRYKCKSCSRTFVEAYIYKAYQQYTTQRICNLLCESVCLRGISRLLEISNNTVIDRIIKSAAAIIKPFIVLRQKKVEVDELKTYIRRKKKEWWVAYALDKAGKVIDFVTGPRNKKILNRLIDTLLLAETAQINTDDYPTYQYLIPKSIHKHGSYCINHIERNNLTVRTHLKRLSRKTICYSKSKEMLEACLKIYFWGTRVEGLFTLY